MNYRKIIGMLSLLIAINLLIGAYLIFFVKTVPTYTLEEYKQKMGFYDNIKDIKIYYFQNYDVLANNYRGDVDLYYLIDSFNILIDGYLDEIAENTKKLDETQLEKYFTDNYDEIEIKLGITEFDEFKELASILIGKNIETKTYTGSKLIKETLLDNERYVTFLLEIYYEDVTIKLNVRLSNIDNTEDAIIKFTPVKEDI